MGTYACTTELYPLCYTIDNVSIIWYMHINGNVCISVHAVRIPAESFAVTKKADLRLIPFSMQPSPSKRQPTPAFDLSQHDLHNNRVLRRPQTSGTDAAIALCYVPDPSLTYLFLYMDLRLCNFVQPASVFHRSSFISALRGSEVLSAVPLGASIFSCPTQKATRPRRQTHM